MSWVILTFIAIATWTVVNILDRHTMSQELREPAFGTLLTAAAGLLLGLGAIIYTGGTISTNAGVIAFSVLAGVTTAVADFLYYFSLRDGQVNEICAVFSLHPIFGLIIGLILLGERVTTLNVLGIALIVGGSVGCNVVRIRTNRIAAHAAFAALGVALGAALIAYFTKLATETTGLAYVLFWLGVADFVTAAALARAFGLKKSVFRKPKFKRALNYLLLSDAINLIATFSILLAYTRGPISLILPLVETKTMFIFLITLVLGLFAPSFLNESMKPREIVRKFVATGAIVAGMFLVIN